MQKTRKGFTITELVIVIAVIAILAAVLIPTFSNLIGKANDSANLQEARNIMTQYIASKDAKVPSTYYIAVGEAGKEVYFKVTNGEINEEAVAASEANEEGNTIVSKATTSDGWPQEVVVTTTAATTTTTAQAGG